MMIELLEPTGQIQKLAPLQMNAVPPLAGKRIGILDNVKPNFRLLATLSAEKLRAEFGAASIEHFYKENAAVGATAEVLDKIAHSTDVVLTGSAD